MSSPMLEPVTDLTVRRLTAAWLMLGIGALLASGLLALLLVLSRTPALQDIVPWVGSFRTALVIHVDLSVVIWCLAFAGVLWSLAGTRRYAPLGWLAFTAAASGTAVMALSPFLPGDPQPLINNYIPVLDTVPFLAGLVLVGTGFTLAVVRALATISLSSREALGAGGLLGAAVAAVAMMAFLWSWTGIPATLQGEAYYELLFWGGGHVLQFTHVLLVGVVWLRVADPDSRLAAPLLVLAAAPAIAAPVIFLANELDSAGFRLGFTRLMQYGHLGILPLWTWAAWSLYRSRPWPNGQPPVRAAILCSLLLFAVGGVLGFLIEGVNVVIPAHYHGSIVGVTLAYMGLSYFLLPRLGFGRPMERLATLQPFLYGGGQLLHILGLAWSGGQGVQRKVAGAAQGLESVTQIAGMTLMGVGGVIAVVGGVLFLVVVIHALWRKS